MRILSVTIQHEPDIVLARHRARQLAELLGFEVQEQTRIATAVSEIGRNAFLYAGGGRVDFEVTGKTAPQILVVHVHDQGPGIANLEAILDGAHRSQTGMGLGIVGARRLMDQVEITSHPGQGTSVQLKKLLPGRAPLVTGQRLAWITNELSRHQSHDPFVEIQQQNQELLHTLEELRTRQEELVRLNRELEDTNRGVVALYAELDEKADYLRRADELKTRFLSNMSHEFRTPVNSILALSHLLLEETDGALTIEQKKQVSFIQQSASTLAELINDLLDIAKIEAGKVVVRPAAFDVAELFSSLRGMLRPLLLNEAVALVFAEPQDLPTLYTDESKVSQILRNFLSNALKFTERGEVRASAALSPAKDAIIFAVADTGIGIAPEDQETIFQEFTQLEHPLQRSVKGTGLGLPLCRKLAELLGGSVSVQSAPGLGSTFFAAIPVHFHTPVMTAVAIDTQWEPDPTRLPVLIVEDEHGQQLLYERYLKDSPFQAIPARSVRAAREILLKVRPCAILLDIILPGGDSWEFLTAMKADEETRRIPILVVTAVEDDRKGLALGADVYVKKPIERAWLLGELARLTGRPSPPSILLIDDEEVSRYVLKQYLAGTSYVVREAASGLEGLRRAHEERPQLIVLDMTMPEMDGQQVLKELTSDPVTKDIPVIVSTAKMLQETEFTQLGANVVAILPKSALSRKIVTQTIKTALSAQG